MKAILSHFFCLGLESDPNEEPQSGVTERFFFVDGTTEGTEFFQEPFVFPWKDTQPNDNGNDDDCVM